MNVTEETRQRLHNAADAFFYAGVLTSLAFDAVHVDAGAFRHAEWAGDEAIAGPDRRNRLGAPPLVNFGLAIELYLKLLIVLAGGDLVRGHDLLKLFIALEEEGPDVAASLVGNHAYSLGCREEFIETLKGDASVFEEWRYAHEKEILCSSPDTLLMIASACRQTVCRLRPELPSAFKLPPVSDA